VSKEISRIVGYLLINFYNQIVFFPGKKKTPVKINVTQSRRGNEKKHNPEKLAT
jgi:hypothetical protein